MPVNFSFFFHSVFIFPSFSLNRTFSYPFLSLFFHYSSLLQFPPCYTFNSKLSFVYLILFLSPVSADFPLYIFTTSSSSHLLHFLSPVYTFLKSLQLRYISPLCLTFHDYNGASSHLHKDTTASSPTDTTTLFTPLMMTHLNSYIPSIIISPPFSSNDASSWFSASLTSTSGGRCEGVS